MVHTTWLRLGRADKGETRYQLHIREHPLYIGLDTDTILNQHHSRVLMEQWGKQFRQQMIVDCFQTHNHHVALRHFLRMLINIDLIQMERSVAGIHLHAIFLHKLIITVRQEMDLLSAICQLAAVIAAYGTHANNSVTHLIIYDLLFLDFGCKISDFFCILIKKYYLCTKISNQTWKKRNLNSSPR